MNRFFTFTFFIMFAVQAYPQKVESIAVGPSSRVYEVIRPNEEKISISNGLTTQFLDVPLFKGDYVYGRVALDVSMFGLDLLYKTVCYNWKTGKLCLAIDGNIKNMGDDQAIIEEYHTKYGNNKIPAYGCYDLSSKKYLEDVQWEHYIEENNSFLFFNGKNKNNGKKSSLPISHLKEYPDNVYMHNGVEAVDLGLSVKWASFNIGNVSVPQNSGIGIKTNFEGDCAQRFWGGSWRMPTEKEFQELIEKCEWEGVQAEGTYLIKATGPSGNFVYFYTGSYMPAHNYNSSKFNVYHIQLMWATGIVERNVGQCYPKMLYSIRPVCNK